MALLQQVIFLHLKKQLQKVLHGNTRSAPQAQSLLSYVFNEEYIEEPIDTGNGRYAYGVYDDGVATENIGFTLAPNPANNYVTAMFNLINENDVAEITITDLQGRKIFSQKAMAGQTEIKMDVAKLAAAGYIVELRINGTLIGRNKLLISKQ